MEAFCDPSDIRKLQSFDKDIDDASAENKLLKDLKTADAENRNLLSILKSSEILLKDKHEQVQKHCFDLKEEKENLEQKLKVAEEKNKDLMAKISSGEQQIADNDKKIADARSARVNIAEERIVGGQQDRAICDLLQNVTQTRFDKESSDKVLQGLILHGNDVEPFSFNLAEVSENEIRNQFWDKLKAGSSFFDKSG